MTTQDITTAENRHESCLHDGFTVWRRHPLILYKKALILNFCVNCRIWVLNDGLLSSSCRVFMWVSESNMGVLREQCCLLVVVKGKTCVELSTQHEWLLQPVNRDSEQRLIYHCCTIRSFSLLNATDLLFLSVKLNGCTPVNCLWSNK